MLTAEHTLISQALDGRAHVQDFFGDGVPTFQLWSSSAVDQVESEKITLYSSLSSEIDYELMSEHTLSLQTMSDFFYAVGESLIGDM